MQIIKAGSRSTKKAATEYLTGTVWQDPISKNLVTASCRRSWNRRSFIPELFINRDQEAGGIVSYDGKRFHSERRLGLISDGFTKKPIVERM